MLNGNGKRPYKNYDPTELGKMIVEFEDAIERNAPNAVFMQKQLALIDEELDLRDWEDA